MPLIPVLAAGQGTTVHPYRLTMDGVDVILRREDGPGPNIGTPLDSIEVVHQGPGGVSSMRFTIEDPGTSLPLPHEGSEVLYWDLVNDRPIFRGRVNIWKLRPTPPGRSIEIDCTGPEVALDAMLPSLVFNDSSGDSPQRAMASLVSYARPAVNVGEGGWGISNWDTLYDGESPQFAEIGPAPFTLADTTVRQAFAEMWERSIVHPVPATADFLPPLPHFTVDMYGYALWWPADTNFSSWTTLTISDTAGGAIAAKDLRYEVVPGDIIHEVYIKGANAASTGWFGDGTGISGPTAQITDSTLDTAIEAQAAATAYINSVAPDVRGSFRVSGVTLPLTVNPGGLVTITDAQAGLSAETFTIYTITKRWLGGTSLEQEWKVDFGGRRGSAMRQLRNLTRDVLN